MMKMIATALVAVFLPLSFASPAEATRPILDYSKDRCHNLPGIQRHYNAGDMWRYKVKTPRKGDCRWIDYLEITRSKG